MRAREAHEKKTAAAKEDTTSRRLWERVGTDEGAAVSEGRRAANFGRCGDSRRTELMHPSSSGLLVI